MSDEQQNEYKAAAGAVWHTTATLTEKVARAIVAAGDDELDTSEAQSWESWMKEADAAILTVLNHVTAIRPGPCAAPPPWGFHEGQHCTLTAGHAGAHQTPDGMGGFAVWTQQPAFELRSEGEDGEVIKLLAHALVRVGAYPVHDSKDVAGVITWARRMVREGNTGI